MQIKCDSTRLLLVVDLMATFVFALEGALAAIQNNLDLLGILVLAFVTAVGGGTIRDLLIGSIPPNSVSDSRYATTVLLAAIVAILGYHPIGHVPPMLLATLDAAGLSLCAVAGAAKSLDHHISPVLAILMGGITGVGGGTLRDILLARIPIVLRSDIYATAALLGAAIVVFGWKWKMRPAVSMIVGGITCFALRILSLTFHWNLPHLYAR